MNLSCCSDLPFCALEDPGVCVVPTICETSNISVLLNSQRSFLEVPFSSENHLEALSGQGDLDVQIH
jgi:hypothetical protein